MNSSLLSQETQLRTVLDAIPSMIVVVDRQMRILDANRAAIDGLGRGEGIFLLRLCGEVLRCGNLQKSKKFCGETEFCEPCLLRRATDVAMNGGSILRQHQQMELTDENDRLRSAEFFITANPFRYNGAAFVLMVLDDVTELLQLRKRAYKDGAATGESCDCGE